MKQLISGGLVVVVVVGLLVVMGEGEAVDGINVVGAVCCTSSGNCEGGAAGVAGAGLALKCISAIGAVVTLSEGTTGAAGDFNLSAMDLLGAIGGLLKRFIPCQVILSLPLNQTDCHILNTATGALAAIPTLLNTVTSPLYGLLANFEVSAFYNVTTA